MMAFLLGIDFFISSVMLVAAADRHQYDGAPRSFWNKASSAAFVAHVLWTVYRHRVLFSGTTTSFSRRVARFNPPDCPGVPATGIADFLVSPGSLHKCIQGKVARACIDRQRHVTRARLRIDSESMGVITIPHKWGRTLMASRDAGVLARAGSRRRSHCV